MKILRATQMQRFTCIPKKKENKKVLLRERKRHTARRVASIPNVVLPGYPPPGRVHPPSQGTPRPGYPPPPARVPPGQGTPARVLPPPAGPGRVPLGCPMAFWECCKALWDTGTPPLQVWTDKQSETITFPSSYVRGR